MKKMKLLAMLLACTMLATSCGSKTAETEDVTVAENSFVDEVIMQVNGEDVMKSEYMVYLYTTTQSVVAMAGEDVWVTDIEGMTADEVVEERTLETLRKVKASVDYAAENGIVLSDEDLTMAEESATGFMSYVSAEDAVKMGITEEKLFDLMCESTLFGLVYQELATGYVTDEVALEAYYADYRDLYVAEYTYYNVDSVVVAEEAVAEEVLAKAMAGADFGDLFDEYDIDETSKDLETKGKMAVYKSDFMAAYAMEEAPEVGVIDEVIAMNDVYYILTIDSIEVPTDEEAETMMRTVFNEQAMALFAMEQSTNLIADQEVVYMEEALANIAPFHD